MRLKISEIWAELLWNDPVAKTLLLSQ